ncbi:hypothetical protein NM208_g4090 [Fusarium decemcellulare]|uniref:Uncharacterized protein n=1 Tax=Fusarium decemcellulare TaxID=57161 RepID=A0ACC1SM26_9HYPO|nr:hypothetical protein NM208_g4090 [Fusarium decemcellulare]
MSKNIFRMFNPGEPKPDPVEKRRAQLRRAQQNYRDRKDKYTKCIEKELEQTRTSEARLLRECDQLHGLLQNAVGLLTQQGLDLPSDLSQYNIQQWERAQSHQHTSMASSAWVGESTSDNPHFSGYLSQPDFGEGMSDNRLSPNIGSPGFLSDFSNSSTYQAGFTHSDAPSLASSPRAHHRRSNDDDEVVKGMEFVLKIEEPCLDHIHGEASKPNEPGGHSLTVTSHLYAANAHPSQHPHTSSSTPDRHDAVPPVILDRLLDLAPDLSNEDQITPVQAWNEIRSRPQLVGLKMHSLQTLAERLKDTVKCYGFGAVIQRTVFESMLSETLFLAGVN